MRRLMGAVVGALALAACETTETLGYVPPASGPTATVVLSREYLVREWEARAYIVEPGGAVRSRLSSYPDYTYNQPYKIPAGKPILIEIESGQSEFSSDGYVIGSEYFAFTPVSGATYLVRPYRPGFNADGSIPGPVAPVRYVVVDDATRKPPPDIKQQLMP